MNPLNKQKEEGQVQATETPIPTALFLLSSSWKQREVKGRRELELRLTARSLHAHTKGERRAEKFVSKSTCQTKQKYF